MTRNDLIQENKKEDKSRRIIMGLDISTSCIGVCVLEDDGSEYGKILELTHVNPKIPNKIKGIEALFIKKKLFSGEFLRKWKSVGIDKVIIESPLLSSNNVNTVGMLLQFNGMISDCVYNMLGIIPDYISSYDARKFSFPEFMAIRKYGKDGKPYDKNKILSSIEKNQFVLFGSYPWDIDKKSIIQSKVSEIFPNIEWLYDVDGELKKENFDACDAYVACLGFLNKEKKGELIFKSSNIKNNDKHFEYDLEFWNNKEHRKTFF